MQNTTSTPKTGMSGATKTILITVGIVVVLGLIIGGLWLSAHNSEVSLRASFNAQQKSNESSFDKTWKTIKQEAQVAQAERESFRKTYVQIMDATEGVAGRGMLASFFKQAKIEVTPELFKKLMTTIEAQRETFHRDQQKLLQFKADHDKVLAQIPSSWFVGGRDPLQPKIVTSTRTQNVFSTGKDDDVDLGLNK